MDLNLIIETIVNEPIYLTITVLLLLVVIYSVLKKFFKLLIIILTVLLLYIAYLIVSDKDLPGESEQIVDPLLENAGDLFEQIGDEFKKLNKNKDE